MNIKIKSALTLLSMILLTLQVQSVGAENFNNETNGIAEVSDVLESSYLEKLELGDGVYMPRFIGEKMTVKPATARIVIALEDRERRFRIALRDDNPLETCYASLERASDSCRVLRR